MGLFDLNLGFSNSNASSGLNRDDTAWMYDQQSQHWRANTEWFNHNGYTMLREGLEKAGYNPLMALGAQPLNGATVQGSAVSERSNANSFNIGGLPLGRQAFNAQMRNINADTMLKGAQTEENISRSNLENTQKILSDKEIPFKDRMLASELLGLELQNKIYEAQRFNVNADTNLKYYQTRNEASQKKFIDSQIDLLKNQKIISDKQAIWLKNHPKQAQWTYGIGQWTGAVGNIFGGNAGLNYSVSSPKK